MDFCRCIEFQKSRKILIFTDANLANSLVLENMTPMSTSTGWPLFPIFWSIQNRECTTRRVNIPLGKPCWHSPPTLRFLSFSNGCPPDYPMWYTRFSQDIWSEFGIIFLIYDTIYSWKYLKRTEKLVSFPYFLHYEIRIFFVVFIKNSRTRSIVTVIRGNERTREGFHNELNIYNIIITSISRSFLLVSSPWDGMFRYLTRI